LGPTGTVVADGPWPAAAVFRLPLPTALYGGGSGRPYTSYFCSGLDGCAGHCVDVDRRYGLPYVAEYWSSVAGSPPVDVLADASRDDLGDGDDDDDEDSAMTVCGGGIGFRSYSLSAAM